MLLLAKFLILLCTFQYPNTNIEPYPITLTLKEEKIISKKILIKSAFAEYFETKKGGILYIILYSCKTEPQNWRKPYNTTSFILKITVNLNQKPHLGKYFNNKEENGYVWIIYNGKEYLFGRNTGYMEIQKISLKKGGTIEGFISFKDKKKKIKGNFKAIIINNPIPPTSH